MNPPPYPVVRLKPKADARRVRHGAAWVFDSDLVLDRRTRSLAPGSIVVLESADRTPMALAALNPQTKMALRIIDPDPTAEVDLTWFVERLTKAQALRERLYDQPYYRLIHAEGDGLPGLVIDRFGDTAVVQPNAAWVEAALDGVTQALTQVSGVKTVLKSASGRTRALEGLDDTSAVLVGEAPGKPVPVPMNGAIYQADLTGGQKTGLFYDQRPNHAFVAGLSAGCSVLDVFSHVGGFSLAALAHGATQALAVDGSAAALDLAQAGAEASGHAERFRTRRGDAFAVLDDLAREAARFDVVICDPPAFAPSKQALDAGLRAYERVARLAASLVSEGGVLCLCSCSHAATLEKFRAACVRGIGRAGRRGALIHTGFAGPDHPMHPATADSGYLKALVYAL